MTQGEAVAVSGMRRELVFQDGSSHKFWNIELAGNSFTVHFGRVGTAGQEQTKEFASEEAAKKAYDKLVAEKLKKGYVETGGATAAAAQSAAKAAAKPAARSKSKGKTAADETTADESTADESTADEGTADEATADEGTGSPQPAAAASPAGTPVLDLEITRRIDLSPADWSRATFRPRQVQQRDEPAPFDLERCVTRLVKLRTTTYGWDVRWSDLQLTVALSREEAHFWLEAMTAARDRRDTLKNLAAKLAKGRYTGDLSVDEASQLLRCEGHRLSDEFGLVLANLFSFEQSLDLLLGLEPGGARNYAYAQLVASLMRGFQTYALPYATEAEIAAARKRLRKNWDPTLTPSDPYEALPPAYYLAALVGMHEEIYQLTSSWDEGLYGQQDWDDHYRRPQDIVFGLGSPELVETEWRRLRLKLRTPEHVRAFLACTEYAALDCVRDSIIAESNKDKSEALVKAFTLVHAPEAAEPMLEVKLSAKAPSLARQWFETDVGNAVAGLISAAAGRGKLAEAALEYLRGVKRKGHAAAIAAALKSANDADVAAKIQRDVLDYEERTYEPLTDATTPDWLKQELEKVGRPKARKLPTWAEPAMLPPLPIGERQLNGQQLEAVLSLLASTLVGQPHPLLAGLRKHVEPRARDEFAWKLFQAWQEDGAPSKEKWAMGAIGHLGGDGCALKLTPLVRAWPGESQHQRAVFGLECLRAIGSDVALMQLAGCAQKLKFKGLKAKAEQFVNEIAAERGMTRAELEDRVIPDCGLDEQGRREFHFGPRSFSFVLGSDLKAMVRDADGKLRGDLPKPGAKDDAALAEQSLAEWKLMKKQIKEVATVQAARLEQAMVTGRRWKMDDFVTLLVRHPLMSHLARSLVWGAFDDQGQRLATFRVTEERDFADAKDGALSPGQAATVGVLHPLELSEAERSAWGEVLSDYEIVSPFPQFGRAIYTLAPGEVEENDLKRFHELQLVAPTLVFTLEKLGWIRGLAMDAGCFDEHSKQFPAADVTALVGYEGTVGMGYIDPNEMLTIKSVQFVAGMRPPSGYGWDKEGVLKLGAVPPVVMSEVLADLQVLKSKAK